MIFDCINHNITVQKLTNKKQLMALIFQLFLTIKLLFLLIDMRSQCQQQSPLRLGADSQANDIKIIYSSQSYYVVFKQAFQYRDSDFTFCFRERPVLDKSDMECELSNSNGSFDCITYSYDTIINYKWKMSSDFSIQGDRQQVNSYTFIDSDNVKYGFSFSLNGQIVDTNQSFSLINKSNTFYEVLSVTSVSVFRNQPQNIKRNFLSTFYSTNISSLSTSDNMLMQKQAVCFRHDQIYHVLFLGGIVRDSRNYYMHALVSYNRAKLNFKMWAGLSYSSDHVSRDMVGIDQMFGTVDDLFSLYASAPFEDLSSSIKGNSDYVVLSSSGQHIATPNWAYYIQFYRSMQTGDTRGDEIIRFKINNKYCFVSSSEYSQQNFAANDAKMFLSKKFMHQYLKCFIPDLCLDQTWLLLSSLALGCYLMIFFLL